jgi:hypothetical protein
MQGRDDVIRAIAEQCVWFRGVLLEVEADVVAAAGVRGIGGRNDLKIRYEIKG